MVIERSNIPLTFDQIVHMPVSFCLPCLMFDNCFVFSHFIMVSSSIPYVSHHSIYGNTNLVVECARYFEKSFPFLTWGYCVSLYLWNTIYYIGIIVVFGMFDGLCRIYTHVIVNAIHCPWDLFISKNLNTYILMA